MPKRNAAVSSDGTGEPTLTFESAYRELEQIVEQLERGDLQLEQALELHERGRKLAAMCAQQLEQAELKITKLDLGN